MCGLLGHSVCTLAGSAKRDDICIEMRTDSLPLPRSAGGAQFSAARVSPTINFYDAAQISLHLTLGYVVIAAAATLRWDYLHLLTNGAL